MRLIDVDRVRDRFANIVYAECNDDKDNVRANRIIDAFDDLPTIEAEPLMRGKWECAPNHKTPTRFFVCSECRNEVQTQHFAQKCYYNFCPNCGAKMESE